MKFSKKTLLSLIENQNLSEMPMDFSDVPNPKYNPDAQEGDPDYGEPEKIPFPHRPEASVQQKLATGDTPLKKIPLPKTGKENEPVASNKMNFQELLASESYKEVIANVQQYGGLTGNIQNNTTLTSKMYEAFNKILEIESQYKPELEQLAIELVEKEMKIPHGRFNIEAKLIDMNQINKNDFNREQGPENNEPEVDIDGDDEEENEPQQQGGNQPNMEDEVQLFKSLKDLNLEKAKRRLINAIIQGGSKRGHYMYSGDIGTATGEYDDKGNEIYTYQRVPELLTQITGNEQLTRLYGILMSINDTNYWQFSNEMIKRFSGSMVGRNHVIFPNQEEGGGDDQEQPDMGGGDDGEEGGGGEEDNRVKIVAVGAIFPVLVHEIVKGVYEAFAGHGLPDSEEQYNKIAQTEDVLEKEMWDLRLGPAIFNRLRNQIDVKYLVEEDYKEIQNFLLATIFKLPAKRFLVLMKEVLSGSKKGAKLIQDIIDGIENTLNGVDDDMDEFDNELEDLSDQTDNDELKDFILGIPGITLSNDDDEEDDDDDLFRELGLDRPTK